MNKPYTFSKDKRLITAEEFKTVFSLKRKIKTGFFLVSFSSNVFSQARLGFALAKKIVRSAVKRNTIRRIVRESFRLNHKNIPAFDIVITLNNQADWSSIDKKLVWEDIDKVWQTLSTRYNKR